MYRVDLMREVLKTVATSSTAATFADPIARTAERFGINTQIEIAIFLASAAHESKNFEDLEENMNYSATRMLQVWGSRVTTAQAAKLAHKPREIANYFYGGLYGNDKQDDGWNYRGSGIFGLTFKSNFREVADIIGIDIVSNPDLVRRDPLVAAMSAGAYWKMRGLAETAAVGDFRATTRRINKALLGMEDRQAKLALLLPKCGNLFAIRS